MSELRASLLVLGVVFIAALAWWERRRPRQARAAQGDPPAPPDPVEPPAPPEPGGRRESAERSGPAFELPEIHAREPLVPLVPRNAPAVREGRGAYELPILELPPMEEPAAAPEPATSLEPAAAPELPLEAQPLPPAEPAADPAPANSGAPAGSDPGVVVPVLPGAPPPLVEWPPDDQRKIVALRLVAPQPERFAGRSLRQALTAEGFVLGRFDIFHKPDEERRAVLSAASLTRPGTFDVDTMDSQHYGGLSLFAVLPGPKSPPQAFEELVSTARSLNDRLCGVLQDETGTPLTPARIATLRERIRAGASS
ncbi:MAG TPA: cell division protein ZipA C-terminal FtsZ-binding domain-containing protein [Steroidobacteraceae bacterium]|nr:cell division protein ZipA C-terminal FtsZ-binding domain-containing protein [Steroidobacteraceae bacterium]